MSDTTVTGTVELVSNKVPSLFNDDTLTDIKSFSDALAALKSAGVAAESSADYGTGFELVKDKNQLVGVPFIILQWRFNKGDFGAEYVAAYIVTKHNAKLVITDGSAKGVAAQLRAVTDTRIKRGQDEKSAHAGLMIPNGLVRSDFQYVKDEASGELADATAFYLSE